jgi:hypothetical protein
MLNLVRPKVWKFCPGASLPIGTLEKEKISIRKTSAENKPKRADRDCAEKESIPFIPHSDRPIIQKHSKTETQQPLAVP